MPKRVPFPVDVHHYLETDVFRTSALYCAVFFDVILGLLLVALRVFTPRLFFQCLRSRTVRRSYIAEFKLRYQTAPAAILSLLSLIMYMNLALEIAALASRYGWRAACMRMGAGFLVYLYYFAAMRLQNRLAFKISQKTAQAQMICGWACTAALLIAYSTLSQQLKMASWWGRFFFVAVNFLLIPFKALVDFFNFARVQNGFYDFEADEDGYTGSNSTISVAVEAARFPVQTAV